MSSPALSTTSSQAQQDFTRTSEWVAEQFLPKFYDVLLKHPDFMSKFYKEHSSLSVWTDGHATAQDLQGIQDVISHTVAHAQCFPQHVDSMFSIDNGVCIQVVGVMLLQGMERQYVQTFFLATQEGGFFVLNDMLKVFPPTQGILPQPAPIPVAPIPPALVRPAMQEEVAPDVPHPKLLQEMQANYNRPPPAMNGPAPPQQHPPHPAPPAPSPAPAPHTPAASRGQRPEAKAAASSTAQPAAPEPQPKGGLGASPVPPPPPGQQVSRPAAPPQPPKLQVPTPPPNMSMADRLKFIKQHEEMQRQALIAHQQQAAQQQQQAAKAAQHAQQQQQQPQQQQQQQQAEPQQIEPQREDRPSRAMQQQQQRQQRQQQQQQQQGTPKGGKPEQQQQQQQPQQQKQQQEPSRQQPSSNGNAPSQPPVHGVYVRNLPQGEELTEALLAEHFGHFGALKSFTEVPAVTIAVSPKYGKVAYIKFEQSSSVQAAKDSPPTIGTQRCEVLHMMPGYANGPQPGMRGMGASRGGFRSGGAPRRGGNRFGDGRPPRSGGGARPEGQADRQGSPSAGPGSSSKDQGSSQPSERPPRPARGPDRSAPGVERSSGGGGGGGGRGGGRRSRSGSASRPKRDQGGNVGGQTAPQPTPTYVPVAPKS